MESIPHHQLPKMLTTLRDLFPDRDAVRIYPDDFTNSETGEIEKNIILDELVSRRKGHFSDRRVVVLFRPGTYRNINFPVGYWTQVLGLGESPDQVTFEGSLGVYCLPANTDNPDVGALDTFWRSAENFQTKCSFVQESRPNENQGKWCVPVITNDETMASLTPDENGQFAQLYPIGDLNVSHPDEAPRFSAQFGMLWAVSQAAAIRRVQVAGTGNLHLSLGNNCSSGGFTSNISVGGYLLLGSQQQFCFRNCDIGEKVSGGAWSMVFNGCRSEVNSATPGTVDSNSWVGRAPHVSTEKETATQVEKPYLFVGSDNKVFLGIPTVKSKSQGANFDKTEGTQSIHIDNATLVRVFEPKSPFDDIQNAANSGTHVVLSPGTYNWGKTLEVSCPNFVLLGIGMATIQAPTNGSPCIRVLPKVEGVRIAGVSLEASVLSPDLYEGSTLLTWGDEKVKGDGIENNPGTMHDLYCFVGGRSLDRDVRVQTMVKIYSNHVMGDNLWLWRADHTKLQEYEKPNKPELSEYHVTTYGECQCDTGLEVFGDYVSFHGLAIEHSYKDLLAWYGHHGVVNFFQSELPYDVAGSAYCGVTGYRVHPSASHHTAKGVGVYCYFRDFNDVSVESAVINHAHLTTFENVFTVWLNGHFGIKSVINGDGGATTVQGTPVVVKERSFISS
eukprot:Nitzschia sp. Nitz4//scaffold76_size158648//1840//3855//NITZ4_002524-RA/size158648-exonerate_est2genome-gene-0.137-mRNA-1//-1//CDS//3329557779//5802//frame0